MLLNHQRQPPIPSIIGPTAICEHYVAATDCDGRSDNPSAELHLDGLSVAADVSNSGNPSTFESDPPLLYFDAWFRNFHRPNLD